MGARTNTANASGVHSRRRTAGRSRRRGAVTGDLSTFGVPAYGACRGVQEPEPSSNERAKRRREGDVPGQQRAERSEGEAGEAKDRRDSCPVAAGLPAAACLRTVVGRRRPSAAREMASPAVPSWNQIAEFLESMDRLRHSVGLVA